MSKATTAENTCMANTLANKFNAFINRNEPHKEVHHESENNERMTKHSENTIELEAKIHILSFDCRYIMLRKKPSHTPIGQ